MDVLRDLLRRGGAVTLTTLEVETRLGSSYRLPDVEISPALRASIHSFQKYSTLVLANASNSTLTIYGRIIKSIRVMETGEVLWTCDA